MFKYLEIHNQIDLDFNPCYQDVTYDQYTESNIRFVKYLYVDVVDKLPPNAPKPRRRPIQVYLFVESDHAGDRVTRNSQTGVLLYLNISPIIFY